LPHVADLRHVKDSLMAERRCHFGKIIGPFSPTVPPVVTRSARVDGDVEASGGEDLRHVKKPYNLPWNSQIIG
jgi:hypothetical protein